MGGDIEGILYKPQLERQPVCPLPLLERQQVELEQQLARQQIQRQQSGCGSRNSPHFSPFSGEFLFV